MKNIFKSIFRPSNKENDLNRTACPQPKRGRSLRGQNAFEEDDEPENAYHAPPQPRKYRATRSVAGGERLDDRYDGNSEFRYRDHSSSRPRHDYNRHSQKRTSKHYRHQKTSEYGSGEASPLRYRNSAESDSESENHGGAFRDSKRVEKRFEELYRQLKDQNELIRKLSNENDEAHKKMRSMRHDYIDLKATLKEFKKENAMLKQRQLADSSHAHFNYSLHQPGQFGRHSTTFDPTMPPMLHPNMNSSMHRTSFRGAPYCMPTQFSPVASTSGVGAGESLANQSSQFVLNMNPMSLHDDCGDETKVFRDVEDSSITVSYDDSHEAEELRSGTPDALQFTPQISSSSITLIEESEQNPIINFAVPKIQKRATVSRSLSFNN